jgi:hypothetical protein
MDQERVSAQNIEPTPLRQGATTTPPRARDGTSCSPLGRAQDAVKDGVKRREAVSHSRVQAKDAANASARRALNLHLESGKKAVEDK